MAAIHISALSNRMSAAEEAELLAAARGAAVQIERDLARMHGDPCAVGLRAPRSVLTGRASPAGGAGRHLASDAERSWAS